MDAKEKIIQAQTEIINNLANCETAIAELYATYSEIFPDRKDFWLNLSGKEKHHAALLQSLRKQLSNGNIFYNIGRFDQNSIQSLLNTIQSANALAKENNASQSQAIRTALSIESSVVDAHFYDIVKSDAAEFKIIADKLSTDTYDHVKTVRNKMLELEARQKTSEE